jgi:hypothetical protein
VRPRKLIAAASAALMAVLPAVALAQGQPPAAPTRPPFAQEVHPPAPDYSRPDTWAALPDRKDAADMVPPGAKVGDRQASAAVDVFYINPTTELRTDRWNSPFDDAQVNAWTDVSVVSRQAAAFNAAGRVYAPRYRQAAAGASDFRDPNGRMAFDLAYGDVKRAFDYYLANFNKGRPFILVGHSQGAHHLNRLLEEEIDGTPLQKRMVAAYSIGIPQTLGQIAARYKSIRPCAKPTETQCLIIWNTYLRGGDTSGFVAKTLASVAMTYGALKNNAILCVNPLTFDADKPKADAAANLGALATEPAPGPLPALVPKATGAECVGGIVIVDPTVAERLQIKPLPGGFMHYHDVSLFWENVRENAVARTEAFLRK